MFLLEKTLHENKAVKYYVDYVARLQKMIAKSSYGKAPDVIELGQKLRKLKM